MLGSVEVEKAPEGKKKKGTNVFAILYCVTASEKVGRERGKKEGGKRKRREGLSGRGKLRFHHVLFLRRKRKTEEGKKKKGGEKGPQCGLSSSRSSMSSCLKWSRKGKREGKAAQRGQILSTARARQRKEKEFQQNA